MTTRKYALSRIGKGDYLLLSNNGTTVWRIAQYDEDGSAQHDDGTKVTGRFWGTWKYTGRDRTPIDPQEWNDFEMWDSSFKTRAQAITSILGADSEPRTCTRCGEPERDEEATTYCIPPSGPHIYNTKG